MAGGGIYFAARRTGGSGSGGGLGGWMTSGADGDFQVRVFAPGYDAPDALSESDALGRTGAFVTLPEWIAPSSFDSSLSGLPAEWRECRVARLQTSGAASVPAAPGSEDPKRREELAKCPPLLAIETTPRRITATIEVRRGSDVADWFGKNPDVQKFLGTFLGQGMTAEWRDMLNVRSEDLKLPAMTGPMLLGIAGAALDGGLRVDLNFAKGRRATVLSFAKERAVVATTTLRAVALGAARAGFVVDGLPGRIVEILLGERSFYLYESEDRYFVAASLSGLFDALVTEPLELPADNLAGSVVVGVRSEAVLGSLLKTLAGQNSWPFLFGFELDARQTTPAGAWFGPARVNSLLTQRLSDELLRAIPFDTFSSVVAGIRMPMTLADVDWKKAASGELNVAAPGAEQGLAIIWDLDGRQSAGQGTGSAASRSNRVTEVGVAVQVGTSAQSLSSLWFNSLLTDTCADGKIAIAATSSGLLTRMRESCGRRSLSALDAVFGKSSTGSASAAPARANLGGNVGMFVNPGVGGWQTYLAGGGDVPPVATAPSRSNATQSPADKSAAEAAAVLRKARLAQFEATKSALQSLPVFGFARASADPIAASAPVVLGGFKRTWEHAL